MSGEEHPTGAAPPSPPPSGGGRLSFRRTLALCGLGAALPFLGYLVYLSQQKVIQPDQIIVLAFIFSVTFPTLILLSLLLFRSLTVMTVSLPVYMAVIVSGYARMYMAFGMVCDGGKSDQTRDALSLSLSAFTGFGGSGCLPAPEMRLLVSSEAFFGYLGMAGFTACLVVILVRLIASDRLRN